MSDIQKPIGAIPAEACRWCGELGAPVDADVLCSDCAANKVAEEFVRADCAGDETLWVYRYAAYMISISGMSLRDVLPLANAAYDASGEDSEHTPEEVASSDYAELMG